MSIDGRRRVAAFVCCIFSDDTVQCDLPTRLDPVWHHSAATSTGRARMVVVPERLLAVPFVMVLAGGGWSTNNWKIWEVRSVGCGRMRSCEKYVRQSRVVLAIVQKEVTS